MNTTVLRPVLAILVAVVVAVTAGCSSNGPTLTISDPHVKAMPAGEMSAAFATLANTTGDDIDIIGARSEAAETVELHEMVMDGPAMTMSAVEKIVVPAGGTIVLEPGGLHIMLIGLSADLEPGDDIEITLVLSDGEEISFTAVVRDMPNAQESYHS